MKRCLQGAGLENAEILNTRRNMLQCNYSIFLTITRSAILKFLSIFLAFEASEFVALRT